MKTILAVSTCPRPQKASYVEATLESIDAAGADLCDQKIVISDGAFDRSKLPAGGEKPWDVIEHMGGPSGSSVAMWRIFEDVLALGADQLIFVEDDIIMAKNAVARILKVSVPEDLLFVTYFDPDRFRPKAPPGLYRFPTRVYMCNQCFMMPRRSMEYLLAKGIGDTVSSDTSIVIQGGRSPWPWYGSHCPCLVEHVGDISQATPHAVLRKGRVATNFYPDVDAMDLPHFRFQAKIERRDPARIPGIMIQLEKIWTKHPDLPLPLLLANVTSSSDLFHLEDQEMIEFSGGTTKVNCMLIRLTHRQTKRS